MISKKITITLLWASYILLYLVGMSSPDIWKYIITFVTFSFAAFEASKKRYYNVIFIMIAVGFWGIDVNLIKGFPKFRIEDIIGFTIVPWVVLSEQKDIRIYIRSNHLRTLLYVFVGIFCASTSMGYFFNLTSVEPRDFTVVIIFVKFIILLEFVSRIKWDAIKLENFFFVILLASVTSAMLAILQTIGNGDAIQLGKTYFAAEWHAKALGVGGRQTATTVGPGAYSPLMLIALSFVIGKSLLSERRFLLILSVILLVIALLSTGSRSGIFAFLGMLIMMIYLTIFHLELSRRLIAIFFVIPIIIYFFDKFLYISNYMQDFLMILKNPYYDESFEQRWTFGYQKALQLFNESPIFGRGPAKSLGNIADHSDYYYFLSRYGIIGLIWFLSVVITSIYISFKMLKCDEKTIRVVGFAGILLNFGVLPLSMANSMINGTPIVQNLYFTTSAIIFTLYHQTQNIYDINIKYKNYYRTGTITRKVTQ